MKTASFPEPLRGSDATVPATSFALATYNVFRGRRISAIVKNIEKLAAQGLDIICLQEMKHSPGKIFLGDILEKKLGSGWQMEYLLGLGDNLGLAILWRVDRFDLKDKMEILLPRIRHYHPGRQITALRSLPLQRGALSLRLFSKGAKREVRVTNVHLDFQGGVRHRTEQFSYLAESLRATASNSPEIICGDMNTLGLKPWRKVQTKYFSEILGDRFIEASRDIRKSWRVGSINPLNDLSRRPRWLDKLCRQFGQRLDYIWSAGLQVSETGVLYAEGSDHYPVLAKFEINE